MTFQPASTFLTHRSTPATLWILEDDPSDRFIFEETLLLHYQLCFFERLTELEEEITRSQVKPDLLILDVRLPDRYLIESNEITLNTSLPFIVVSSVDELDIIRLCLRKGAVDYFVKPFKTNELLASIEIGIAQGTKPFPALSVSQDADEIRLLADHLCIERGNTRIELTLKEFKIFKLLYEHKNAGIHKHELFSRVWENIAVGPKALDAHLVNLRKKIIPLKVKIDHFGNQMIRLIPGDEVPIMQSDESGALPGSDPK